VEEVSKCMTRTNANITPDDPLKVVIDEHQMAISHPVVCSRSIEVVPRFTAEVVVVLRAKLGLGAMDRNVPGNVAVVRARAARIMRDYNVRSKDVALHLHYIERAFFEDETMFTVPTWRERIARKSQFCKWAFKKEGPIMQF
jgi:hypothetical protein